MSKLERLTRTQVEVRQGNTLISYRIAGEYVDINVAGEREGATSTYAIEQFVEGVEGDVDLFLQFARLDGLVVLYWRETYLHRVYRQGLVELKAQTLVPICQGVAGANASH